MWRSIKSNSIFIPNPVGILFCNLGARAHSSSRRLVLSCEWCTNNEIILMLLTKHPASAQRAAASARFFLSFSGALSPFFFNLARRQQFLRKYNCHCTCVGRYLYIYSIGAAPSSTSWGVRRGKRANEKIRREKSGCGGKESHEEWQSPLRLSPLSHRASFFCCLTNDVLIFSTAQWTNFGPALCLLITNAETSNVYFFQSTWSRPSIAFVPRRT